MYRVLPYQVFLIFWLDSSILTHLHASANRDILMPLSYTAQMLCMMRSAQFVNTNISKKYEVLLTSRKRKSMTLKQNQIIGPMFIVKELKDYNLKLYKSISKPSNKGKDK